MEEVEVVESVFSEHWARLSSHLDEKPRQALENHLARQPTAPTPANSTLTTPRNNEELILPAAESPQAGGVLAPNLDSDPMGESEATVELSTSATKESTHGEEVMDILRECLQSYVKDDELTSAKSRQIAEVVGVILQML